MDVSYPGCTPDGWVYAESFQHLTDGKPLTEVPNPLANVRRRRLKRVIVYHPPVAVTVTPVKQEDFKQEDFKQESSDSSSDSSSSSSDVTDSLTNLFGAFQAGTSGIFTNMVAGVASTTELFKAPVESQSEESEDEVEPAVEPVAASKRMSIVGLYDMMQTGTSNLFSGAAYVVSDTAHPFQAEASETAVESDDEVEVTKDVAVTTNQVVIKVEEENEDEDKNDGVVAVEAINTIVDHEVILDSHEVVVAPTSDLLESSSVDEDEIAQNTAVEESEDESEDEVEPAAASKRMSIVGLFDVMQTGTSSLFSGVVSDTAQLFQLPATSDNTIETVGIKANKVDDDVIAPVTTKSVDESDTGDESGSDESESDDDDDSSSDSDGSVTSFKSSASAEPEFTELFTDGATAIFTSTTSLFNEFTNIFDTSTPNINKNKNIK
jgi:hypothetical protein